ncbi:MAG: KamA family radical SAM protein [Treponema sp.]|nr:KamA family radical SAM protein [Treponema sp.]MCL2130102.1 KamA family radical SAM protein [Treponema sp.]
MLITAIENLPPALAASVRSEEREWILKKQGLPFAVTPHFASLAGPEKTDPIRQQFMPSPLEAKIDPFALADPLGEELYRITPRLVHQYSDRVLLLAGGSCAGFCRYCFRRETMSSPSAFISGEELKPVLAYLESQPGIREVLVSGGDPLTARDAELEELFLKLRRARPEIVIRLCSRIPIVNPGRLNPDTIAFLGRNKPLRMAVHINHPGELSYGSTAVLSSLVAAGIPVLVQTVLLRGINDNAETLAALFGKCLNLGLSPYYLFQLDLAPGVSHFRVPLKKGLLLYEELKSLFNTGNNERDVKIDNDCSGKEPRLGSAAPSGGEPRMATCKWSGSAAGSSLPPYAVDLPGGGGKIILHKDLIAGEKDNPSGRVYLLKDAAGKLWEYPVD